MYAGTRNVYPDMVTAAKSLLLTTRVDRVVFLTEDDTFPEWLPKIIEVKNISGQTWFDPAGPNYSCRWTYMTLIRLALPEILPEEDRCLWLDVDTLCVQDIGDLFDMDLQGNTVAMAEEPTRSQNPFVYHNAGVCLMDLRQMAGDRMRDMIRMINTRAFTAPDQDALNIRLQHEILTIPPVWNSSNWTKSVWDARIVHFAGDRAYTTRSQWHEWQAKNWEGEQCQ